MARVITAVFVSVCLTVTGCGGGGGGGNASPTGPSAAAPAAATVSSVRGWTGTLEITSDQPGSGSTQQNVFLISEVFRQQTTARLNVSLSEEARGSSSWAGTAQGSVNIRNTNTMTMVVQVAPITCTGTLAWVGTDPVFSSSIRLESSTNSVRVYLNRTRIPAPDSGSVECPYAGLSFPTVDPNSPFAPIAMASGQSIPAAFDGTKLTAITTITGESGLGGFVAGPTPIVYIVNLNLTAVP